MGDGREQSVDSSNFVCVTTDEAESIEIKRKKYCHTYEQAIQLIGYGKFHRFQIIVAGLCLMSVICETMGVTFYMPIAKCDFEFGAAEERILVSSGFFGVILSSYIWGLLADTWGRQKALRVASTCALIFSLISSASYNYWMLIILRVLVGFFISACQVCTFSYIGEFHGNKTRAKAIAFSSMFLPLAFAYMPAVAMGILPKEIFLPYLEMDLASWRIFIVVCSIPNLLGCITLRLLPESPKFLIIQGEPDRALEILKKCFQLNTNSPVEYYSVRTICQGVTGRRIIDVHGIIDGIYMIWQQTAPLFNRQRIFNTINIICLAFFTYAIAHGVFIWIPNIMEIIVQNRENPMTICKSITMNNSGLSNSTGTNDIICPVTTENFTYLIMILTGASFTISCALIAFIVNLTGTKNLLICWMTITGLCSLALYWTNNFYLIVFLIIIFLSLVNAIGLIYAIAIDYYPTNLSAMATSIILISGRFGDIAGSNVVGILLPDNCNILFCSCATITLIFAFLSIFLPSKSCTNDDCDVHVLD